MSYKLGANPCPKCRENGGDAKGDNFHFYGEGRGGFCFKCGYTELSEDEKSRRSEENFQWTKEMEEEVTTQEKLTEEQIAQIKGYTGERANNLRGISDKTYRAYGVRHKYDEETGEPVEQYYPITEGYAAAAYKIRLLPKRFSKVGKLGKQSDLFGQWKWKTASGKFVVLVAGEIDCLSAYQMLEEYRLGKNSDFEPIPVVSSIIGETGSHGQCALHYEWFDRFERIIVIYDQDKAGQDALKDLVKVLPKGKMFTVDLPMKDCNEMLSAGKQKAFIDCFWKAKPYTPDGIIGSGSLSDKMRIELSTPKIPLPPFMHKLQKMMAGGIPLGRIVNLGSASGTGKSTITDELLYYWVFNSPHKIGVVSLESDAGQYGIKILSRHCGTKIELFETPEDALQFMDQDWVKEKERELLFLPNGQNRWHIVEDRDGGVESMKKQIMKLIVECECMVVILDPLQDILDGLSNEDQAVFLRWMKGVIKSHGVTFITINHVRKSGNGQKANSAGAELYEEDMSGSSTIFKSGACNLLFSRNKEAEDAVERNTTKLKMTKCRWSGITGYAGEYYYCLKEHTLWDKEEYFSTHTVEF